jgi:predicted dehydrogenase/threonine dehydrogenase-like Zn-dependent dehydrogenase
MKQLFIKKGSVFIEDVPAQLVDNGSIKVEVFYSFISPGTEITGLEQSGQTLIKKAINKPANIKKFVDRSLSNGLSSTINEVRMKSGEGISSGYSLSGRILEVGANISGFKAGDRIACAGAGIATHSEIAVVPKNLFVPVPKNCSLKAASSVAIGSIALQGVRRSGCRIGETVAVIGLGLIGQITIQLLKASGCHVIGLDLDRRRVNLALELGMDYGFSQGNRETLKNISNLTDGFGVDATIVCAASESNIIIQQAMEMTRKKGRVIVVGAVGLGLQRKPFYEKEIDFLISCSYGPGRYDPQYELEGIDYPRDYVRWTENRNMAEYLRLIAEEKIKIDLLVERTYPIESAAEAFEEFKSDSEKPLGVVLEYNKDPSEKTLKTATKKRLAAVSSKEKIGIAVVGCGSFAVGVHLPNIKALQDMYSLQAVVGRTGASAGNAGRRFSAGYISTNYEDVLKDPDVDLVMICTRHNLHASMAIEAIKADKAVFLEKPMAMDQKELDALVSVYEQMNPAPPLIVGFNRRFSHAAIKAKKIIETHHSPMMILYRVKANPVPQNHWVQSKVGGGRIIGEACHMIDLFNFFTGASIVSIDAESIAPAATDLLASDNFAATLKYADGSICTLVYTSQGSAKTSKEYIEIFSGNQTIVIDDFKRLRIPENPKMNWTAKIPDKGHLQELKVYANAIKNKEELPIPFISSVETTKASFLIHDMLRS